MTKQEQDPKTVCQICGKTLTRAKSVEAQIGHRCDTLQAQGWDAKKLEDHYTANTGAPPDGYIKVADLHRKIDATGNIPGLTVSKMVKAIGKDRAVEPPLHPIAKPVYDSRRTRWVDPWLATKAGLTAIATGDFSNAPEPKS